MKIPKYVDNLIDRRARLAYELAETCVELDNWLEAHGFNLTQMSDYTISGCMIYCEPDTAAESVRNDILNKE